MSSQVIEGFLDRAVAGAEFMAQFKFCWDPGTEFPCSSENPLPQYCS